VNQTTQNSVSKPQKFLEVGTIVGVQGLRGEVRIYPESDFPQRFLQPGDRWLLKPGSQPELIKLLHGRYLEGKGLFVVQLAGIDDRTQAEALRGAKVLVLAGDRPQLDAGEFHVADLIGLDVFDQITQTMIGAVTDVIPAGNDLLEIKLNDKPERVLIPFVMAIVPVVDLAQHRIEITPPIGLINNESATEDTIPS
jgi:16S rRNA processing protein RimM